MRALFILICLAAGPAFGEALPGPYRATVVRVIDGDTIEADVAVWVGLTQRVAVRVDGVDAPELRAQCPEERRLAERARAMVEGLTAGGTVTLTEVRRGKYAGRVVARVTVDGRSLDEALIAAGLGRPYDGGKREGWCSD